MFAAVTCDVWLGGPQWLRSLRVVAGLMYLPRINCGDLIVGKRIAVTILCVVVGLVLILLIGIGLSGVLGEPAPLSSKVGVARTGGHLVVYGCTDDGIGSIEIQAGAKPGGRLLWSAVKNAGAPGSRTIALDASVAGYSVRGTVAVDVAGQVLALRAITD